MRYFTDSPFERLMMEVPHGHSLAAEAAWRHEQQATGKPAAFSLTSKSERRSSLNSTLIIAEKPSVALAIAAVVGADKRKNGYLEGNGYLVSWCVGHLVSLAQPENYDLRLARWRRADLPILPDPWQYVPNEKTKKQLDLLCSLMNRPDIETIVCATDAGREGELIFRLVYDCCRCSKPVKRLWISSLEESAIREGMAHLKDAAEYDLLYEAALCRAKADWLVGINLTRLYTLLYGPTLSIGRVMTPTLAMIVEREKAVAGFTPKPFYTVHLLCPCEAASERFEDEQEAQALADACNGQTAEIIRVEKKTRSDRPPKLYDLTALQREANQLFGYTAQQTLDCAQSLYEKKLATYPRTDSRFLTHDMASMLPNLAQTVAALLPFEQGLSLPVHAEQVIDDAGVSDHHAIIPTQSVTAERLDTLTNEELNIFSMLAVRLLCAVGEPHVTEERTLTLSCAGHIFTAAGKTDTALGWRIPASTFYGSIGHPREPDERAGVDPALYEHQRFFGVRAVVKKGLTAPPKRYTEATLLAAMESAGADSFPDEAGRKGIGTPATRAGIIEKLVKGGFIERRGEKAKQLLPTDKGRNLIAVLPETLRSPLLTAQWENQLCQVEHGNLASDDFLSSIETMIRDQVDHAQADPQALTLFPTGRRKVAKCPCCGYPVSEAEKGYFCENRECSFGLFKDNKFFAVRGKKLDAATAVALLNDGKAAVKGMIAKSGKKYDGTVVMELDESVRPCLRVVLG